MFNVREPVSVECITSVNVLYFHLDELYDKLKIYEDIYHRMH